MPKVSVIIPTYNRALLVGAAIESVLAQTYRDFELIVVDDGSTDDTRQVVERYPQARYIYQENRGEPGARNTGIQASTGEYVAFLDADDTYLPDKLERQVLVLDAQSEFGAVYSDVLVCDAAGNSRGLYSSLTGHRGQSGWLFEALVWHSFIAVHSVLVRRIVLDEVGLFDETLPTGPDWDLWLRVAAQCAFFYIDAPLAYYWVHGGMVTLNYRKMWQGSLAVRRKLIAFPAFDSCSSASKQYCYYQLGLLDCLAGDMAEGRRYLWRAFRQSPSRRGAALAWVLTLLGRQFFQLIMICRIKTRGWTSAV